MQDKKTFSKLFSPGQIGTVRLKNRIVKLPIGGYFCGVNGDVTDRTIAYYVERAKGGTGLITVGMTGVTPLSEPITYKYFTLGENRLLQGHYHLTEALHIHGANVSIQLSHVGAQMSTADFGGRAPLSPSGVQQFAANQSPFGLPRPMSKSDIYELVDYFVEAAARAKKAGYDMVELHAAHGYLLNAFLSPATNKRTDEFGGSSTNRSRIVVEIIKGIHELVGNDFPIVVRINADDFVPGGITPEESQVIARILQEAGASALSVSCGMFVSHDKMNDTMDLNEGWKLPLWEAIKKVVTIPIIAGGGNRTFEFCEKLIAENHADFAGLGRPLLADPYWPQKVKEGKTEDINRCISCLRCMLAPGGGFQDVRHCTVNAMWGREVEYIDRKPPVKKKKVVIVGAGVAGMEAARVASMRGHEVTLFEKEQETGGQLSVASIPTSLGKQKLLWVRNYLETQMKKQGVKLQLGHNVTADELCENRPDVIVIATGGQPLIPDIPGIKSQKVVTAWDILARKEKTTGQRVAVLGGNLIGCETAVFLAERGNQVMIIKRRESVAEDMEPINQHALLTRLKKCKVEIITGQRAEGIAGNGVHVVNIRSGKKQVIEADLKVLALGVAPVRTLAEELRTRSIECYEIGDCSKPRDILKAIEEGFLIGYSI